MDEKTKTTEMKKTLKTTMALEDVRFFQYLKSVNSPFVSNIERLFDEKAPVLAHEIPKVFGTYTLHDISHSMRLLEHCYDLVSDLEGLSQLEVTIIIYAAIMHDIGMAVTNDELGEIKSQGYTYKEVKYSSMMQLRNGDEKLAMQDFIRKIHAERSHDYVLKESDDMYLLPGQTLVNFKKEVAQVCIAHTKHHGWITNSYSSNSIKGDYPINLQFCSLLLRLGDLLDFDSNRTPPVLYKMIAPSGYGAEEWKQHFIIDNNRKVIEGESGQKTITVIGESDDPKIHRKFLQYMDWIEKEIASTLFATKSMPEAYRLHLNPCLDNRIETKGYSFSDKKLRVDYHAIVNLLMGEKIYGDTKLALRELIQNSIDACKVRSEFKKINAQYGDAPYLPTIKIYLNKAEGTVGIRDNGMGMNSEIITRYFLNIGKSYYTSESFLLKDYSYKPIGNFGIGFLAGFMMSNEVSVKTRYIDSDVCISIDLEKDSEYVILGDDKDLMFDGTLISLNYSSFMHCFNDKIEDLRLFLEKYFLTDGFSIELIDVDEEDTLRIENPLCINIDPEKKNEFVLPLTDYLKDVNGVVKVKYADNFVLSLDDIGYSGGAYFYDGKDIKEIDNSFDISVLCADDLIERLVIPIIDEGHSDELAKYYDVLEDYDEAIDKMSDSLDFITIFLDPSGKYLYSDFVIEEGDSVIDDIEFDKLVELGQDVNCVTKVYHEKINIHEYRGHYLLFRSEFKNYYWAFHQSEKWEIFVRNILIKDYKYQPETIASIMQIDGVKIDIFNESIIPSVSRNDFDNETAGVLNYAISKAIHCSALEHLRLNEKQKDTLRSFIKKYFSKTTSLEVAAK